MNPDDDSAERKFRMQQAYDVLRMNNVLNTINSARFRTDERWWQPFAGGLISNLFLVAWAEGSNNSSTSVASGVRTSQGQDLELSGLFPLLLLPAENSLST